MDKLLPKHATLKSVSHSFRAHAGHSLGGAVASLAALRLLKQAPEAASNVSVIGFAAPAVGNAALADHIQKAGWEDSFTNLLLPGAHDFRCVRLVAFSKIADR